MIIRKPQKKENSLKKEKQFNIEANSILNRLEDKRKAREILQTNIRNTKKENKISPISYEKTWNSNISQQLFAKTSKNSKINLKTENQTEKQPEKQLSEKQSNIVSEGLPKRTITTSNFANNKKIEVDTSNMNLKERRDVLRSELLNKLK